MSKYTQGVQLHDPTLIQLFTTKFREYLRFTVHALAFAVTVAAAVSLVRWIAESHGVAEPLFRSAEVIVIAIAGFFILQRVLHATKL